MNDLDDNNNAAAGGGAGVPGGGDGGGMEGGGGALKERSSWYRSQFKELENLGKGGFGTVVKVSWSRAHCARRARACAWLLCRVCVCVCSGG